MSVVPLKKLLFSGSVEFYAEIPCYIFEQIKSLGFIDVQIALCPFFSPRLPFSYLPRCNLQHFDYSIHKLVQFGLKPQENGEPQCIFATKCQKENRHVWLDNLLPKQTTDNF